VNKPGNLKFGLGSRRSDFNAFMCPSFHNLHIIIIAIHDCKSLYTISILSGPRKSMERPSPAQVAGQKRKVITRPSASADRKRQKTQNARFIPIQSSDAAFSATGELDVAAFVKAREFEINALEKSMQKSKKGLTMRAFQQIPRSMRRRTASHNVKKIPRRLRKRAEKEVGDIILFTLEDVVADVHADQSFWIR